MRIELIPHGQRMLLPKDIDLLSKNLSVTDYLSTSYCVGNSQRYMKQESVSPLLLTASES